MEEGWKLIVLGIFQGFLEWLPVSSQGQLVLVMTYLLGVDSADALGFSVYLHSGTLIAVAVYFRRDLLVLLRKLPSYRFQDSERESRVISFLLFTTVLTGIIGYFIYRIAEATSVFGEFFMAAVSIALISTGLIQKFAKEHEERNVDEVKLPDTLVLGLVQGLSAFPGVSRSGITISALLMRGFKGEAALKLSFLMSIPAVLVAEIGLASTASLSQIRMMDLLLGSAFSFLTGALSIHLLMKTARKIKFWSLCLLIGILALLPLLSYL
jgi:undecaprenyl-diphosphatase